ncbi:MAG: hypothetical protein H2043_06415 [Rhizobiales bacterium]|nr:hypothetical protein [Hyphomicrobiales bacterium]
MGYSPADVDEMTLWEFECCVVGWRRANGVKDPTPTMSPEKAAALGIAGF